LDIALLQHKVISKFKQLNMKLSEQQIALLQQMIAQKYVVVQKHTTANLYIYNYTANAQYECVWNEITLVCRGLILDENYNFVARPFTKFFNYAEISTAQLPNETFEVFEKMDGSLGILYWINNQPHIATRGSFTSDQAIVANQILHQKYQHLLAALDKNITYLFEIIYPSNRIVVDYGDRTDLVLLAMIDTATGVDLPLVDCGFPVVASIKNIKEITELLKTQLDNKEGYVIKYASGYRIKIKFDEYVRLHKILTQVSSTVIWELLANEQNIDTIIDKVPDEFYTWIKETIHDLQTQYHYIEQQAKKDFKILSTKKESALYFLTCENPSILFAMYKNKRDKHIIWKLVKPTFTKPFKN
jgi:hypothetical protein